MADDRRSVDPAPQSSRQHAHAGQANPEQSKHLETARVLVLGQWVDFTNLRTETYTEGSRIPVAAFGTAEEVGWAGGVLDVGMVTPLQSPSNACY